MFNKSISLVKLSNNEKVFLFSIIPYINPFDYKHITIDNSKIITIEQLEKITGLKGRTIEQVLKGLINKDIIFKPDKGIYEVNEDYLINIPFNEETFNLYG